MQTCGGTKKLELFDGTVFVRGRRKKVYRRKKFNHAEKNRPNVGGLEKEVVDTRT